MNKIFKITLVSMAMSSAIADEVTIEFTPPTHRIGKTPDSILIPVDASEIKGYEVYLDKVLLTSSQIIPPESAEYTLPGASVKFTLGAGPGPHGVTMKAIDTDDLKSVHSEELLFNVPNPPNPPILGTAVITAVVNQGN